MSDEQRGKAGQDQAPGGSPNEVEIDPVQSIGHFLQYSGNPDAAVPNGLRFMVPDEVVEREIIRVLRENTILEPYFKPPCRCIHCVEYSE